MPGPHADVHTKLGSSPAATAKKKGRQAKPVGPEDESDRAARPPLLIS